MKQLKQGITVFAVCSFMAVGLSHLSVKANPLAIVQTGSGVLSSAMALLAPILGAINSDRKVGVAIQNSLPASDLINPAWFISSGKIVDPALDVKSGQSRLISASKRESTATGAAGVISYDISGVSNRRLMVLYSLPYDYNLYSNHYTALVLDSNMNSADSTAFNALYNVATVVDRTLSSQVIKSYGYYTASVMGNGGEARAGIEIFPPGSSIDPTTTVKTFYAVTVKTGTPSGAGTDANLDLKIIGDKGEVIERLNPHCGGNCFENGATEGINFIAKDVGKITSIQVKSDMSYSGAAWYPASISVLSLAGSAIAPHNLEPTFVRTFNVWIDKANAWY